jgi:hypothetical protein
VENIEQLESRIEELRDAIRRSRRLLMAGRACAILGPVLLGCLMLGVLEFTPVRMIAGITLGVGGMVLTGSSMSSTDQLERALIRAEQERTAAIDALQLVQVGEGFPPTNFTAIPPWSGG